MPLNAELLLHFPQSSSGAAAWEGGTVPGRWLSPPEWALCWLTSGKSEQTTGRVMERREGSGGGEGEGGEGEASFHKIT